MLTEEQKDAEFVRRRQKALDYMLGNEYQAKLKQRVELAAACETSAQARAMTWQLCARPDSPAEGCKFFIDNFGWTLNPKPESPVPHLPFILFDYQHGAIEWIIDHIERGKDCLIEKSREMGATWLVFAWVTLWYWLFRDGVNFLVGSYKEDLVDDKSPDSIFGKIEYGITALPEWMLPKGFRLDKHRTKLKLENPANGNFITGSSMNPNFGRGARKTAILFDELGFWDYAEDAWRSAGASTTCRIANSTPNGYDYYAHLRHGDIDVLTLHWEQHPLKDDEWYAFECARSSKEDIAQELDISYSKSKKGRVYPEWTEPYVQKGYHPYKPDWPLFVSWDFGKSDDTAIIWAQRDPRSGELVIIDTYRNCGKNIDFYVPLITGIIPSEGHGYTEEELDMIDIHKEWRPGTHFGDPSGRFTNQISDDTVVSVLRNWGIIINFKERWKYFNLRKTAAKTLIMNGIKLNENIRTKLFDMRMVNASYPKVKVEGMDVYRTEKPKHDDTSHYRTSFEYLAMGLEDFKTPERRPRDKFPVREQNTRRGRRTISY